MRNDEILILKGPEVKSLLTGRELELIQTVRMAYEAHARGESSLPHSTFLRFPDNERDRIIALPAYLGGEWELAGIKWVASFPGNLEKGENRASALMVLNSSRTGRPEAILEGSIISAKRTAASAALAAQYLHRDHQTDRLGMIGCGLINFEIARFILAAQPDLNRLMVYDLDLARGEQFKRRCREVFREVEVEVAKNPKSVLKSSTLISLATTAAVPHIDDLSAISPGSTILHISLRDFSPQVILGCHNIVDDVDHVCRAQTSVHLTEQFVGNRDFIRCTLSDILSGQTEARMDARDIVMFSPFGLGVLDLAVGKLVWDLGLRQGQGTIIKSFLPESWGEDAS